MRLDRMGNRELLKPDRVMGVIFLWWMCYFYSSYVRFLWIGTGAVVSAPVLCFLVGWSAVRRVD